MPCGHAFLYNGPKGTYTTLNDPPGSNATYAYEADVHGFLYNPNTNTYTTLDDPSRAAGRAIGFGGDAHDHLRLHDGDSL
jgi:hypothetical protein